ncbi:SMI1/KNR4 family protein [Thalassobellus sediminis]|uniref:SMI1/KNR4 family protein n=1 Tax=Thalassobellus sediminis TaxID=3367753 RepID=UPI0037AD584F
MLEKIIIELKQFGITFNRKSQKEDLIKLTKTVDFDFPNDFKDFYLFANGYSDYIGFERQHIWDINKISEENTSLDKVYIKFCDTMLSCPWIGFSRKDGKIYKGYGLENEFDGNAEYVAETFTDFLKLLTCDSKKLY